MDIPCIVAACVTNHTQMLSEGAKSLVIADAAEIVSLHTHSIFAMLLIANCTFNCVLL